MKIAQTIQCRQDGSRLAWRYPCEDFTGALQLIVNESQEALFFVNGQALDLFGAGSHIIGTHNYPLLNAYLEEKEDKEKLFHAEIYFINKTVQTAIKWGVGDKIRFLEPTMGVPLEIGISGEMFLQVSDARKMIIKLLGTGNELAWDGDDTSFSRSLQRVFLPVISMAVKENFATCVNKEKIDIFTIDQYVSVLSEVLRKSVLPVFEEYGLYIPHLMVEHLLLPETDPVFKQMRALKLQQLNLAILKAETEQKKAEAESAAEVVAAQRRAVLEKEETEIEAAKRKAQKDKIEAEATAERMRIIGAAEADVMNAKGVTEKDYLSAKVQSDTAKAIGSSGGGVASDVVSAAVGLQMARTIGEMGNAQPSSPAGESAKYCACGAAIPMGGKFCMACGKKVERTCPSCGAVAPEQAAFCGACGTKL